MVGAKLPSVRTRADVTLLKTFDVGDFVIRHGRIPAEFAGTVIPADAGIQMTELDPRLSAIGGSASGWRGDDANIGNDVQSVVSADLFGDTSGGFLNAIDAQRFPVPSVFTPAHMATQMPQAINSSALLRFFTGVIRVFQPFVRIADTFAAGNSTNFFAGGVGGGYSRHKLDDDDRADVVAEQAHLHVQLLHELEIADRFADPEKAKIIRASTSMAEVLRNVEKFVDTSLGMTEDLMRNRDMLQQALMRIYERALGDSLFESELNWSFWADKVKDQIDSVEDKILRSQLGDDAAVLLHINRGKLDAIRKTSTSEGLKTWLGETEEYYEGVGQTAEVTGFEFYEAITHLEYLEAIMERLVGVGLMTVKIPFTNGEIMFGTKLSLLTMHVKEIVRKGRTSFIQNMFE